MKPFFRMLVIIFLAIIDTIAQDKKVSLLAEGFYFEPIALDPTESITSAGILNLWEKSADQEGIYVPVNLAIHHSLIRLSLDSTRGWEFGLQAAAFTQFEIKPVGGGAYLGGMMNVDYRATGFINYHNRKLALRFRLFHISSHLADDYIIRNDITTPTPNTLNYEQFDVTASYQLNNTRTYAGVGYIFTPNSIRERWAWQLGTRYRQPGREDRFFRFTCGLDIKLFEENDYRPNYRVGIGSEVGPSHQPHLLLMLDFYNGHLPYSTLEYREVTWLGVSCAILPKRITL